MEVQVDWKQVYEAGLVPEVGTVLGWMMNGLYESEDYDGTYTVVLVPADVAVAVQGAPEGEEFNFKGNYILAQCDDGGNACWWYYDEENQILPYM